MTPFLFISLQDFQEVAIKYLKTYFAILQTYRKKPCKMKGGTTKKFLHLGAKLKIYVFVCEYTYKGLHFYVRIHFYAWIQRYTLVYLLNQTSGFLKIR